MQASPRIDELRQKFHENPRRYFAPLANEYRKAGDPEQAIAICRAHLAQQPGHMSGHVVYGQALYDAKRPEEARNVFEKALSLDPDNTVVLRSLGDIAREKGESAEARHWYSKALDLDPHDTEVAAYIAELTEPISGDDLSTAELQPPATEGIHPTLDSPQPSEIAAHIEEADAPRHEEFETEALEFVEADTEEAVAVATPAEPQGDGADPESPDTVELAPEAAPEAVEIVEAVEAAEPAGEPVADREVAIPEVREPEHPEDIEAAGEVEWRKTPRPQESPFITRTMADLYARQGYLAAALDVYRQLAIRHPHDDEIQQRIAELSKDRSEPEAEPIAQAAAVVEPEAAPEPVAEESVSEPEPQPEPVDSFADLSEEPVYSPVPEEAVEEIEPEAGLHFTEMELADSMSNGPIELDDSPFGELSWENEIVEESGPPAPVEPEAPVEVQAPTAEAEKEPEPEQEARFVELPVALGEVQTNIDEAGAPPIEIPEPVVDGEKAAAEEPAAAEVPAAAEHPSAIEEPLAAEEPQQEEESAVVAYSPEPPRDEDLPHFKPRTPTIREFFATLGAHRPSSRDGSITARAAIPDLPATTESSQDLPLAADAFGALFPDAPVSEEDTRAAFALSGAISGTAHNPTPSTVRTSPPKPVPPVTDAPEQTQESEEDIRRFREWLDGLADS